MFATSMHTNTQKSFLVLSFQDECSFVSLRDIERSMIVFDYFYSKHELYFEGVLKKAEQAEKGQRLFLQVCTSCTLDIARTFVFQL